MEIYACAEKTGHVHAADQRARLRRRRQLLARRAVDRVLVDARRLQPHAVRRRAEAARGRSELLRARSTSCAPTAPGQQRLTNVTGYDGGPFFSPDGTRIIWRRFDEAGPHRRRLDDEARRHRPAADHRLRRDELGALHPSVGRSTSSSRRTSSASRTSRCSWWTSTARRSRCASPTPTASTACRCPRPTARQLAWTSSRGGGREGQIFLARVESRTALAALAGGAAIGSSVRSTRQPR